MNDMSHLTQPQQKIVQFIRLDDQGTMEFTVRGTIPDAQAEIQRMRVELSRQRGIVKSMGRTVRPFKMKVKSIVSGKNGLVLVTLLKDAGLEAAAKDLDEAFAGLVGGEQPNV